MYKFTITPFFLKLEKNNHVNILRITQEYNVESICLF